MRFKLILVDEELEVLGQYEIEVTTNTGKIDNVFRFQPNELEEKTFLADNATWIGEEILDDIGAIYRQRKGGRAK
jgi:hypothetical protein